MPSHWRIVNDWLLRKGLTMYEFVGKHDVLHVIKQAKAHIAQLK